MGVRCCCLPCSEGPSRSSRLERTLPRRRGVASAAGREEGAGPSHAASAYVGTYGNPVLGSIEVEEQAGALGFAIGSMRGSLDPWHHDTFRALWDDVAWSAAAGPAWVTFRLDRRGEVEALIFEPLPGERWRFERGGGAGGAS